VHAFASRLIIANAVVVGVIGRSTRTAGLCQCRGEGKEEEGNGSNAEELHFGCFVVYVFGDWLSLQSRLLRVRLSSKLVIYDSIDFKEERTKGLFIHDEAGLIV
jgi:hypothetical protein